jgi:tetratricopeptide (TPR) repeat protein
MPDPQSNLEEAQGSAREAARGAGILGVHGAAPDSMASIFGRDSALGAAADSKIDGLVGTEVGDAYGAGGFGLVGSGKGGGGTGEGTVGLGNLGTIGRGSGSIGAYGSKSGTLRNRRSSAPITVPGTAEVRGSLDKEIIRRIIRRHINEVKFCYERELTRNPSLQGRVMIQFTIGPLGNVPAALVQNSTMNSPSVEQCIASAVRRWEFPRPPGGGIVIVSYPFVLKTDDGYSPPPFPANRPPASMFNSSPDPLSSGILFGEPKQNSTPSYTGTMLEVMTHLEHQRTQEALAVAQAWRRSAPGDVLALTALGAAQDAAGNKAEAERAFGSILDLYPSRADLRRYAGSRLESLRGAASEGSSALRLAADTYQKAVEQRPDHPNSHRLRAYALLKLAQPAEAFAALRKGLSQRYPSDRFRGVDQILREDLGLVAAAWRKAEPDRADEIQKQLSEVGVPIAVVPSLRFILSWETDANDVDFHIHDGKGGHAYYSQKELPSGGELYADVTTGYGPECFAIRGTPAAFPYRLEAHYYSRGPMGYGMGRLQILSHDGKGGMRFEDRPFVVMNDGAYVNLGSLEKPLAP